MAAWKVACWAVKSAALRVGVMVATLAGELAVSRVSSWVAQTAALRAAN